MPAPEGSPCPECDDLHHDLLRVMAERNGAVGMLRMVTLAVDTIARTIEIGNAEQRHADALREYVRIASEWGDTVGIEVIRRG